MFFFYLHVKARDDGIVGDKGEKGDYGKVR